MIQPYVEYLEHQIQSTLGLKVGVHSLEEWKKKKHGKNDTMW